ncbi:hypothetical protein CMV_003080 [Castanea mollissima]|uniref:Pentatricopeptide repeat-containing protein n=1 Tax=Castanea mollissima TaxID=60419 RepID=A0A8J4RV21_9ROSI|nr:hypothetical protein CMV_003080 [Castanea mollissima]
MFKPKTLFEAIELARIKDESKNKQRATTQEVSFDKLEEGVVEDHEDHKEEVPHISLHEIVGCLSPRTMRVKARIEKRELVVLINSGSTHNFVDQKLTHSLGLAVTLITEFNVKVASGESLVCKESLEWRWTLSTTSTAYALAVNTAVLVYILNTHKRLLQRGFSQESARNILKEMEGSNVQPSLFLFSRILASYRDRGEWQRSFQVLNEMKSSGIRPDRHFYNVMIDTFGKYNCLNHALSTFEQMLSGGLSPILSGRFDDTIECLDVMKSAGLKPPSTMYNALINAYAQKEQQRIPFPYSDLALAKKKLHLRRYIYRNLS